MDWVAEESFQQMLFRLLTEGREETEVLLPIRTADGSVRWRHIALRRALQGRWEAVVMEGATRWLQRAFSALPIHLAVVAKDGTILAVNDAWLSFACRQGLTDLSRVGVGVNYLEVCRQAAESGDPLAATALKGLQRVLRGQCPEWQLEYPCRTPQEELWFLMWVGALPEEIGGAVIAHFNITDRKRLEQTLQEQYAALPTRQQWLETVLQLSKQISRVADLRQCLRAIGTCVREGLKFDRVGIFLHDAATDRFIGALGVDREGNWVESFCVMEGTAEEALRQLVATPDGFLYTPDYPATFPQVTDPEMEGVKEHAAVALWAGETPIGALCVDNLLTQRPMAPEQLEALRLFAGYAGIAIQNARLWEERQRRAVQLATLNQLVHTANQRLDPASIARLAVAALSEQWAKAGIIAFLYDPTTAQFYAAAANEAGQEVLKGLNLHLGSPFPADKMPLLLPERERMKVWDFRRGEFCPLKDAMEAAGFSSFVLCPIVLGEELLGALCLAFPPQEPLEEERAQFLQATSEHLAVVLHNAHLFNRLQSAYEELRQAQMALLHQERLRALGQMASGVAHEINNALVPILAFAELLENSSDPDVRVAAPHVRRAVEDIVATVRRLQAFYRPHHHDEVLESVQVNEIVRQVIAMTRPRWYDMPQKEGITIRLTMALDESLPPIAGVASELREALTNLLFNAVDAILAKGEKQGTIALRSYREGGQVVVEVQDDGIGMDEETRHRCIEPFFTTKGEQGSGLGLSIVYGIAQRHGGQLEIESALGQGTTVRLHLPIRTPTPIASLEQVELEVPSLRVLVIDDDARVLSVLRTMLEHLGHCVVTAPSGREGLRLFEVALSQGDPFDLVITDLGMPEISGEEVVQRLKTIAPSLPLIVLTGWGREQAPPGVEAALSKPVRLHELREAIKTVWRKTHPR